MARRVRLLKLSEAKDVVREMELIGTDKPGISLMAPKQFFYNFKVTELTAAQANILKQEMLAVGGECAVSKGTVACTIASTDALISGTQKQYGRLTKKLKGQPYGLTEIGAFIKEALVNITRDHIDLKGRTRTWRLSGTTLIMGILNVTPDSFYDGGRYKDLDAAVSHGLRMAEEGADIIDVGGESSRPGADVVSEAEEIRRVVPVVEELTRRGVAVSVDTVKSRVAEESIKAGAEVINDISALTADKSMASVAGESGAGVILMHMRGTPKTMQADTVYKDLMGEVYGYLTGRMEHAISSGIAEESIALDPGIGFGKDAGSSLELIARIGEFTTLGRPILLGASRKSFIGKVLAQKGVLPDEEAEEEEASEEAGEGVSRGKATDARLSGTIAANVAAILGGASILRVHDVKSAVESAAVADALKRGGKRLFEEGPGEEG